MQETYNNKPSDDFDLEIDFKELFYALWDGKWIIISVTAFMSIVGVIYSLSLPNIYESRTLLAPVNPSSTISGSLKGYSDLVGFSGIDLPDGDTDNSIKAIEKIGSLSFFENSILTNIHLPDLVAFKSWDAKTNQISYNENIYDSNTNSWVEDHSDQQQQIPSAQQSFEVFKNHLALSRDKKTGFVTIAIKHKSPFIAKQWAELVVNEVNGFYREKDKSKSEKAASYLNQQIALTSLSEIKQVLAQLLQEEIKKLTLIEANQFYVFDFIDPPAVMEKKSEPRRSFICIIFAFFGGILGILLVTIRHYVFNKKAS